MKIPHTGCNPRSLILARGKDLSKTLVHHRRIAIPAFTVFPVRRKVKRPSRLALPLVVKSLSEDGSFGISQTRSRLSGTRGNRGRAGQRPRAGGIKPSYFELGELTLYRGLQLARLRELTSKLGSLTNVLKLNTSVKKVQPQPGSSRRESRNSPATHHCVDRDVEDLPRCTRERFSSYETSCREATRLDRNSLRAIIIVAMLASRA